MILLNMLNGLFYFDAGENKLYNSSREQIVGAELDHIYIINQITFVKKVKHLMVLKITPNILSPSDLKKAQISKYGAIIYCKTNSQGLVVDVQHIDQTEEGLIKEARLISLLYELDQTKR